MTVEPATALEGSASRFGTSRIHRDAGAVAVSSVANAILGAGFWAYAAKFIPPAQLGVMTAVLAVIVASGSFVASGIGDAYTALLPAVGSARPRVYRRGQRVFLFMATAMAVVAALGTTVMLREVRGSVPIGILVAIGVLAWAAFTLQNSTIIAIGRARWVPSVNIALGVAKIVLLFVLAFTLGWHSVELAVVISTVALVVALRPLLSRIIDSGNELPAAATISEGRAVSAFNRFVLQTLPLSALGLGLLTLTPFLVTMFAGPTQGALFALSFSLVLTFDFIAASMAVSLVVHAASAPEHAGAMAWTILIRALAVTTVGTIGLVAVMPTALRILNPQYGGMGVLAVIGVLCLSTLARVAYLVWAALQQSRRQLRIPLIFNIGAAALMLAVLPGLCGAYGALGGAFAVLIHQLALTVAAGIHFSITHHGGNNRHAAG